MGRTQATFGYGSLLKRGDSTSGASSTYTAVGEITDIGSAFNISREALEATNTESPDGYEEFIAGMKSGGELTFEMNFVASDGQQAGVITDLENGSNRDWQIILSDTGETTITFCALVTSFNIPVPVKGKISASLTLKVNGKPTLTP